MSEGTFGLTPVQRDCLLVIQELTELAGTSPTLAEIAHEMSLASRGRVQTLIRALKDRGRVDWLPSRSRSIIVLQPIPMPGEPEIAGFFDAPEIARRAVPS